MSTYCKVIILGNLGRDPELTHLPSGKTVCNLSIASTERWTDRATGERREETEWHSIVVWGKDAVSCADYLKKGSLVMVEGRLKTRSWDDKTTGDKRYKTEIVSSMIKFCDRAGEGDSRSDEDNARPMHHAQPQAS